MVVFALAKGTSGGEAENDATTLGSKIRKAVNTVGQVVTD